MHVAGKRIAVEWLSAKGLFVQSTKRLKRSCFLCIFDSRQTLQSFKTPILKQKGCFNYTCRCAFNGQVWNAIPALWYLLSLFMVVFHYMRWLHHYTRWLIHYIWYLVRYWCGACCIIDGAFFFICGITAFYSIIFSSYAVFFLPCAVVNSLYAVLFLLCTEVSRYMRCHLLARLFPVIRGAFFIMCGDFFIVRGAFFIIFTDSLWRSGSSDHNFSESIQKNPVLPIRRCETNAKSLCSVSRHRMINSQNWQHCWSYSQLDQWRFGSLQAFMQLA